MKSLLPQFIDNSDDWRNAMLNALKAIPPASARRVAEAARQVAAGRTPQGHKLDDSETLSSAWDCSLEDAEAWIAAHWGTQTLAEALAHARAHLAS